jgi:hypothetical protein
MSHQAENGIFSDIDTSGMENYEELNNIELPDDVMQLLESMDVYNYFENLENSVTDSVEPSLLQDNKSTARNNITTQEFGYPYNNVPEEWKWDEMEEIIQELSNSGLANQMKEIRYTRKEDTDIRQLANLCMEIQKRQINQKYEKEEGKYIEQLNAKNRKIGEITKTLNQTIRIKNNVSRVCAEIDKKLKKLVNEKKNAEKQTDAYKITLKAFKDISNEKERRIIIQQEQINDMNSEIKNLRREVLELKGKIT